MTTKRRKATPAEWLAISALFDALVDEPDAVREARLRDAKAEPFVIEEVRALLLSARGAGTLDQTVMAGAAETTVQYASLQPGSVIGNFRIDHLIGRGGMGEVYLAHREAIDFEQRVALKMLRPEAVGRTRQFDSERQLLAGLEHPGIARLIDGGVAPDGRPFMALEYVEGHEITDWCAEHHADLATRLTLFLELCDAVEHAHARLVLHLDIKPANILVDRDGRTRLLDFGIARLIDASSLDRALTQVLLTPDYAAPEQFTHGQATVATDVYGLGAVLFELLAGRGPWRFEGASMPSVLRRLLHDDPPFPSSVAVAGAVAPQRLRGDLDAIVMKAMRRAPAARYASAAALAEDVRRFLAFEPVSAREGSLGYRARRFLRRNRWTAGAAAAGLAALLIGAGGIAWQARQTRAERDNAIAEAARSEAVNEAMMLMFRDAGESRQAETITARALVDGTAKRLVTTLDPDSPKSAAIIAALADLYVMVEDIKGSKALLEAALDKGIGRNDAVATAQLNLRLAAIFGAQKNFTAARALLADAGKVWATDPNRFRRERVQAAGTAAYMLRLEGKRAEGIEVLLNNMVDAELAYAGSQRDLTTRYANLVTHLVESNRIDEAKTFIARSEAMLAESGKTESAPGLSLQQLRAQIAAREGDMAGAEAIMRTVVAKRRASSGRSYGLAVDLLQHARMLLQLERPDEALAELDEALPMARETFGPDTPPTIMIGESRAEALAMLGRLDEAQRALDSVEAGLRAPGPDSLFNGILLRTRAQLAYQRGQWQQASQDLDAADAVFRKVGPAAVVYQRGTAPLRARIAAAAAR